MKQSGSITNVDLITGPYRYYSSDNCLDDRSKDHEFKEQNILIIVDLARALFKDVVSGTKFPNYLQPRFFDIDEQLASRILEVSALSDTSQLVILPLTPRFWKSKIWGDNFKNEQLLQITKIEQNITERFSKFPRINILSTKFMHDDLDIETIKLFYNLVAVDNVHFKRYFYRKLSKSLFRLLQSLQ